MNVLACFSRYTQCSTAVENESQRVKPIPASHSHEPKWLICMFQNYIMSHPEITVIDPVENVRKLMDRGNQYRIVQECQFGLGKATVIVQECKFGLGNACIVSRTLPPQGFDTLSPRYEFLWVKHRYQFITSKKEIVITSSPYFQGYVKTFDPL
jgi:hypothetical protein